MTTPAPAGQSGHETTTYGYDSAGNLTTVTAPPTSNSGGAPNDVTAYTYDAANELLTTTTGAGTATAATASYLLRPQRGEDRHRAWRRQHLGGRRLLDLVALRHVLVLPDHLRLRQPRRARDPERPGDDVGGIRSGDDDRVRPCRECPDARESRRGDGDEHLHAARRGLGNELLGLHPFGVLHLRRQREPDRHDRCQSGTSTYAYDPFGELTSVRERRGQDRVLHLRRPREHDSRSPIRWVAGRPGLRPTPSTTATTRRPSSPR